MEKGILSGKNCVIGSNVCVGDNVRIGHNVIIEGNVMIGDNSYIDSNTIIRSNVILGGNSYIGSNCILGERGTNMLADIPESEQPLEIGDNALVRSGTIIYTGTKVGTCFQTGHRVTIREGADIGDNVSVGTLTDIQGNCKIGNYVRMHSNVHVGQLSVIDDFVWIYPYVVLTNDPTPPSERFVGVHVNSFAIIATGAIVMPGIEIEQDSLVAAGAIVTKSVSAYSVVAGNPAKMISDVRNIKSKFTGENVYPWRQHFKRYMPWSDNDFETWYSTLDIDEKKHYHIEELK